MAPRAKVTDEENGPSTTLPADFGEWDSGAPPTTLPDDFTDFDSTPKPPAKPLVSQAPPARPAAASVPRAHAPAYTEFEAPSEPVQPTRWKAGAGQKYQVETKIETRVQPRIEPDEEEEDESQSKGKGKLVIFAIAAILLVAVGIFYALNLRKSPSKAAAPTTTTVQDVQETATEPQADLTTGVKPKPGAATTAPATATTATPATAPATATTTPVDATPAPVQSEAMQAQLNAASKITINKPATDKDAAPTAGLGSAGLDSMGGNSGAPGVFNGSQGPKVTAAEAPKTLKVSGSVMAGRVVSSTTPVYPRFARDARVEGTVVLHATISKSGTISNVSVMSGPQMLRQAALDAVKTWRYKPYLLNNEPVEVETSINVNFSLNG